MLGYNSLLHNAGTKLPVAGKIETDKLGVLMINSISLSIETGGMTVLNLGYLRFVEILIPEITNGPTSP